MSTSLKTLISKLNDTTRRTAERAASLCLSRGHHEVDLEHVLLALIEEPRSDFARLAARFDVPLTALRRDLEQELARLPAGNSRTPVFSVRVPQWLEQAWLIASLDDAAQARIRSGHLLLALLVEPTLHQIALRGSRLFERFRADDIKHRLDVLAEGSDEVPVAPGPAVPGGPDDPLLGATRPAGKTPALDQFTTNLTERARQGRIDPVIGREAEIRQAIDILMRRRQNNPILTGEAGVGKTAVVEGLALRIAQGDVPAPLQGVALHVLDLGLLQAGASVKGEFENRLKSVIDEVKKSPHPIILFIDEAHTMVGAGGQAGQNDAANLLKPALARGELRTVAATTWGEYKKYFEKDAALARRFQVVKVEEPSDDLACAMLRAMRPLMENHFKVRVLDVAITEAVRLSARYISDRQLPDKAISVLDTACAKVALGQSATPAAIEEARRALERSAAELHALEREEASGARHAARLAELVQERAQMQARLSALEERWRREQDLVQAVIDARAQLEVDALREAEPAVPADEPEMAEAAGAHAPETHSLRRSRRKGAPGAPDAGRALSPAQQALQDLLAELGKLQAETALVPMQVDGQVVAEIVSAWTGIPLGKMVKDEIEAVLRLREALQARVVGQKAAIEAIAQRVRTARAGLDDPHKPKGVFLFVGPSGVGKTETALALADTLYGGDRSLITINMSEYQEAHTVSALRGSPPGYVGYGEGGVLTEAVRRKPYSVVLLDEVEKAHPDVLEMFFQVFDKGMMEDAEGRSIDFRNTIIVLTSNVGSASLMQACLNKPADDRPDAATLVEALRPQLYKAFKPAFVGRTQVVPFYPLDDEVLDQIIRLKLGRIADRVQSHHKAVFKFDDGLVDAVLARCTEVDTGARNVDHILSGTLLPDIAQHVLERMAQGAGIHRIRVSATADGGFRYRIQ